jgi:hypothetical protein
LVARLGRRCARLIALLVLIAGLLGPAVTSLAAPASDQSTLAHTGMDCDAGDKQAPAPHVPGLVDCCVANVCAMILALPVTPSGLTAPAYPETPSYKVNALLQPVGFDAAPIPHPPKPL